MNNSIALTHRVVVMLLHYYQAEHQHLRTNKDAEIEGRLLGPAGETKHVIPFGFVGSFDFANSASNCFDVSAWCQDYLYYYDWVGGYVIEDGSYQYAQWGMMARAFCEVAQQVSSSNSWALAMYHARGKFEVTCHGNNGAVFDIDLKTKVDTCTMVAAVANADVMAIASGSGSSSSGVYIYTDLKAFCNFLKTGLLYYWLCVDIDHYASAYSFAEATAYSSAFSNAIAGAAAGGNTAQKTSVYAEGSNLQKFNATIVAGASNFASAESESLANVYAQAFANAYASSYVDICRQQKSGLCYFACCGMPICIEVCSAWDCDYLYNSASAYLDVVAQAYGEAYALSFANAAVTFAANAYFARTKGKDPSKENGGDIIKVSTDSPGFAQAAAFTSCVAM